MKQILIICLSLILVGCASANASYSTSPSGFQEFGKPLGTHYLDWPQRSAQLAAINSWHAQGSIGIHTINKGWNASFNWVQQERNYGLALFGPLGAGRVQLMGTPQQVVLQTSHGSYSAATPEVLLQQQIGWSIPVSDLYYWIRGLPAPRYHPHYSFDMNRHLVQLSQDGWHIIYLRYVSVNGIDLPDRMLISNAGLQVRIVITQWQI
jgi:outer membrane lipoprotein LolB